MSDLATLVAAALRDRVVIGQQEEIEELKRKILDAIQDIAVQDIWQDHAKFQVAVTGPTPAGEHARPDIVYAVNQNYCGVVYEDDIILNQLVETKECFLQDILEAEVYVNGKRQFYSGVSDYQDTFLYIARDDDDDQHCVFLWDFCASPVDIPIGGDIDAAERRRPNYSFRIRFHLDANRVSNEEALSYLEQSEARGEDPREAWGLYIGDAEEYFGSDVKVIFDSFTVFPI